jgi:hypothetical protein
MLMDQHYDIDQPGDRGADGPAAQSRASRIVNVEGRSGGSGNAPTVKTEVRRYECECRLDYLRKKGTITHDQWRAGIIFRRNWLATHASLKVASYGDRVQKAYSVAAIEERSFAVKMLDDAYRVLGPDVRIVIVSVCGQDEALEWVAGVRDRRRGDWLRDGLDALVGIWVKAGGEAV